MQRYRVGFVNHTGNAVATAIEAGDGDYILYSDALLLKKRVKELEAALKAIKVYGPDADGIVTLRWTDYAKDERHGRLPIAGWVRIRADTLPGKELLKWAAKASAALEAPHEP